MFTVRKFEISVCIALVISMFFSVFGFAKTSEEIREDVLRLHVIANSDSKEDQSLKLKVRDKILSEGAEIFDGSVNVENAVSKIETELCRLEKSAKEFIKQQGYDYSVEVKLSREYFTTRTYDTVTLPAGRYLALIIIIGEGKGHNWWCVMFPPMCLPAADKKEEISDVLNEKEIRLVETNPKYDIRFKVVELYEEIKMKISDR